MFLNFQCERPRGEGGAYLGEVHRGAGLGRRPHRRARARWIAVTPNAIPSAPSTSPGADADKAKMMSERMGSAFDQGPPRVGRVKGGRGIKPADNNTTSLNAIDRRDGQNGSRADTDRRRGAGSTLSHRESSHCQNLMPRYTVSRRYSPMSPTTTITRPAGRPATTAAP